MGKKHHDNKLYRKCKSRNLQPRLVCEVGVYMPENSNILDFIEEGTAALLIEPDPRSLEKISQVFAGKNITVLPYAIYDHNGQLEMVQRNASTFVKGIAASPAIINDAYQLNEADVFKAECKVFSAVDNGKIDLISIDIEGSEWYVIKNMISRPSIISIETHGKFYTNSFISEIRQWMENNDYKTWYKTGSDTVFFKTELFRLSFIEKFNLFMQNISLGMKRMKYRLKGRSNSY